MRFDDGIQIILVLFQRNDFFFQPLLLDLKFSVLCKQLF